MKILPILFFTALMLGSAAAQQLGKNNRTFAPEAGAVYGDISIKEASGNNLGNFSCANLTVEISKNGGGWHRTAKAEGTFSSRRCAFKVFKVPAGEQFVAVLKAQFPNTCDQKSFETTTSLVMTLKPAERLKYDFSVSRIRCVQVK